MESMVCKSAIVAGALLVIAAAASPASALTVGPHSKAPFATENSSAQLVQYGYCRRERAICAERMGWRTLRFFICLERRGCRCNGRFQRDQKGPGPAPGPFWVHTT